MKIVEVCPYDMTRPGGVQAHIRDLSAWLRGRGHEVTIVAPPPMHGSPVSGVRTLGRVRRVTVHGTLSEICYVPRGEMAVFAAEMRGAELVHLHTPWTPLLPLQVWRNLKLPAVATFHATLPADAGLAGRAMRAAARYFMKRLDAVIVPSVSPLSSLPKISGVEPVVLPPSVDLNAWTEAGQAREAAGGTVRVAYLGRFEERKGVDVLLEAWRMLASRTSGLELTIAGGGAMESAVLAATQSPWGKTIRYVPEPDAEEARRIVGNTDIFVAPARFGESFGIVLTEAMAAGAVPVAAANSGYTTVMTGEGSPLLVPPGDAAALAERLEALAKDAALRERLQNWGRAHAAAFDMSCVGPRYEKLFEAVLARRGAKSRQ